MSITLIRLRNKIISAVLRSVDNSFTAITITVKDNYAASIQYAAVAIEYFESDKLNYKVSVHTENSLSLGSVKWKRCPPGKENIGFTIIPPAFLTLLRVPSISLL